jgi:hypothetical protein
MNAVRRSITPCVPVPVWGVATRVTLGYLALNGVPTSSGKRLTWMSVMPTKAVTVTGLLESCGASPPEAPPSVCPQAASTAVAAAAPPATPSVPSTPRRVRRPPPVASSRACISLTISLLLLPRSRPQTGAV